MRSSMLYSILVKRYITERMLKFLIRDVLGEHDKRIFAKKFCREFGDTLSIDIIYIANNNRVLE